MPFLDQLRAAFRSTPPVPHPVPLTTPVTSPVTAPVISTVSDQEPVDPLPAWLTDAETLRDEGVLYGMSDAAPDDKLALIRAYTARQTTPISQAISQLRAQLTGLNDQLAQQESRQQDEQHRLDVLYKQQLTAPHPARSILALTLGAGTGIGAFSLIDQTTQPIYGSVFIGLGVCLAGIAGPFSQPAEPDRERLVSWLLNTFGLPLIVSGFVLTAALSTQSVGQAVLLAAVLLALLPTAGRLIANGLRGFSLRSARHTSQPLIGSLTQQLAVGQQEINALRAQKAQLTTLLSQQETELARHNAHCDALIQLFLSEFTLARSLHNRLTEAQRTVLFS